MIPTMFGIPFHLGDVDSPGPAAAFTPPLLFCLLSSLSGPLPLFSLLLFYFSLLLSLLSLDFLLLLLFSLLGFHFGFSNACLGDFSWDHLYRKDSLLGDFYVASFKPLFSCSSNSTLV
jgi:hypothetical protein